MAKITYVATCFDTSEGIAGTLLDIHFENGLVLLVPLKTKEADPTFLRLLQEGELHNPKTDGFEVYWKGGARLSLPDIMKLAKEVSK